MLLLLFAVMPVKAELQNKSSAMTGPATEQDAPLYETLISKCNPVILTCDSHCSVTQVGQWHAPTGSAAHRPYKKDGQPERSPKREAEMSQIGLFGTFLTWQTNKMQEYNTVCSRLSWMFMFCCQNVSNVNLNPEPSFWSFWCHWLVMDF